MPEQKQTPIVIGMVRNEKGQLLIAKRIDPDFPTANDKWEFVGGKIHFNESPEQAVLREVEEETGLKVEIVRLLPKVFSNSWKKVDGSEHQTFLLCYECKIIGGTIQ